MLPVFPKQIGVPVLNHITGAKYCLKRMDEVEMTSAILSSLVSICNEQQIYSWLFKSLFEGKPYAEENAKSFFDFGLGGWSKRSHFIFLLVEEDGNVVAAIDIKSSDVEKAEVGYWSSLHHRGCMTNTAKALLDIAKEAGYKSLYGRVKKGNDNSSGVLLRSGFVFDESASEDCGTYDYFNVDLEKREQVS